MAMALNLLSPSTHRHLPFSSEKPQKLPSPTAQSQGLCFALSPRSASSRSCARDAALLARAVKQEEEQAQPVELDETQTPNRLNPPPSSFSSSAAPAASVRISFALVWQLIVASLLSRKIKSRLLLRDPSKAVSLFGEQVDDILEVRKGDTRNPNDLDPAIFKGVTHVICCTGTTAFPSKRWEGDNTPERVDWEGIRNLVMALPRTLSRFVLVSSVGVTKYNELPWSIMNLFGVLKFKKMGEDFVRNSGIPTPL
uniref:NAD(P)-binding domain-containing protein n=1 Tax=Ananas comosus var. bracteatus TaxID=296719 RepID=A0A6V7PS82_ANACO|nr:unnamed protein product [Ananas comosus var. bracteatus]